MSKWLNITYPRIFENRVANFIWKKTLCKGGFHLFDEVDTIFKGKEEHYLYCDACGLIVDISNKTY